MKQVQMLGHSVSRSYHNYHECFLFVQAEYQKIVAFIICQASGLRRPPTQADLALQRKSCHPQPVPVAFHQTVEICYFGHQMPLHGHHEVLVFHQRSAQVQQHAIVTVFLFRDTLPACRYRKLKRFEAGHLFRRISSLGR